MLLWERWDERMRSLILTSGCVLVALLHRTRTGHTPFIYEVRSPWSDVGAGTAGLVVLHRPAAESDEVAWLPLALGPNGVGSHRGCQIREDDIARGNEAPGAQAQELLLGSSGHLPCPQGLGMDRGGREMLLDKFCALTGDC